VYADETLTTVKNNLLDEKFLLEDTVRLEVVLDLKESSVTTAVQTTVKDIVAKQYGVGVEKIQITARHSDSATAKTTTLTIMAKTLRARGDVSDFSEYSIKQHKKEMVAKIDAALVVATYKTGVQKDNHAQKVPANSGVTTEKSNNAVLIWLLLALLLVMVLGFAFYTRQNSKTLVDYTALQAQIQQTPRGMHVSQGQANPFWHPLPVRY